MTAQTGFVSLVSSDRLTMMTLAGDVCNSKMFCLSEGSGYKSNLLVIVTLQGLVDSYIRLCSLSTVPTY